MPKPELLSFEEAPRGSKATRAAKVRFGRGTVGIVELFEDTTSRDGSNHVSFRGLPKHLGNDGAMTIRITNGLEYGNLRPFVLSENTAAYVEARQERILFEFAIGARQTLWPGATPIYEDESYNPESRHYKPYQ